MFMTLLSCAFGAAISITLTLCLDFWDSVADLWKSALIFVGGSVGSAGFILILCYVFGLFVDLEKPVEKPSKFYLFLYNLVNDFLIVWSGTRIILNQFEDIPEGPCLFVCNHRSRFDPMIISSVFKRKRLLFVSKPGNFKIPIAGKAIHAAGFLKVEREDNRDGLKMVLKAVDYLNGGEYSIGICPEGTRNKEGRYLLPFRNGAFKIAMKARVPIVVVTFEGTENIAKNFPLRPTKVFMDVIKVIRSDEYSDKNSVQIGEEVRKLMSENINYYGAVEDIAKENAA